MNISCVLGCKAADLSVDSSLENTDEKQPTTWWEVSITNEACGKVAVRRR